MSRAVAEARSLDWRASSSVFPKALSAHESDVLSRPCSSAGPRRINRSRKHGNGEKTTENKTGGEKTERNKKQGKKKKKECDETSNRNGYGALGQGLESAGRLQPGRSHESIRGTESTSRRAPSAPILPGVKTAGGSKRLSLLRSPREARAL